MLRRDRPDLDLIGRLVRDPGALVALMDELGLGRVGLITYTSRLMGFPEELGDWILDYARGRLDRLLPLACPDLSRPQGLRDRLQRMAERGLVGIKLHPPHQEMAPNAYLQEPGHPLRTLYETAQELGLLVMIHTGTSAFPGARSRLGDPMLVDDVAVDFPELRLVLAHGGRPLWDREAFFLTRRHANVWLELSGIPPWRIREHFPRLEVVAEKILYGSDWPGPGVASLKAALEGFWGIELPEELKRKALVENPRRLLEGLPRR
jgi:hypothetical protein